VNRESERELLAAGARDIGIALDPSRCEKLLSLVDELELGNAQFNLTAIRDRMSMLRKHVLDSLSLQPYLRGSRVADIGTGAFLPGGFCRLCRPLVCSGRTAARHEGQAAGRGDSRAAKDLSRARGSSAQNTGAGRRTASCGTLTGPAQIELGTMKRVIAVANQKGGVGKTTTAVNLAASLTATKRRVLLIDLDPQGNATMGCGVDKHSQARTSCDVMLGDCAAVEALVPVEYGGFMLMPSNQDLTAAEVRLLGMIAGREFKLRNALKPVREDFDVILIDCPPALNMLTLNALVASDSVMVPMQCEYYALEGLSSLMQTIEQIRSSINSELEIEGLLRTMFDPRNNLANEVSAQLIEHFGDKVFRTMIPRNVRLAEAPSFGKPALFHDKESRGALAYLALAGEMIRRDEVPPAAV
jgi:chromosome partitioning protein